MEDPEKAIVVLGYPITPETVREVIRQAAAVHWGTHLLRWRSVDVTHEGMTSHRDALVPTPGTSPPWRGRALQSWIASVSGTRSTPSCIG